MDSHSAIILQARVNEDPKFPLVRIMGGLYFTYLQSLTV